METHMQKKKRKSCFSWRDGRRGAGVCEKGRKKQLLDLFVAVLVVAALGSYAEESAGFRESTGQSTLGKRKKRYIYRRTQIFRAEVTGVLGGNMFVKKKMRKKRTQNKAD
jgi:hypothetical protein